ncbi:hypothetical protein [Paraburkholderia hayleyella]|uniref:hypothetical protein n=1 Tax=Paraburkholderia hayleyella TaxID=2152889 RepID=UPI00129119CF|nr:hypothetical protein [Paraburkholderia hayleyella]
MTRIGAANTFNPYKTSNDEARKNTFYSGLRTCSLSPSVSSPRTPSPNFFISLKKSPEHNLLIIASLLLTIFPDPSYRTAQNDSLISLLVKFPHRPVKDIFSNDFCGDYIQNSGKIPLALIEELQARLKHVTHENMLKLLLTLSLDRHIGSFGEHAELQYEASNYDITGEPGLAEPTNELMLEDKTEKKRKKREATNENQRIDCPLETQPRSLLETAVHHGNGPAIVALMRPGTGNEVRDHENKTQLDRVILSNWIKTVPFLPFETILFTPDLHDDALRKLMTAFPPMEQLDTWAATALPSDALLVRHLIGLFNAATGAIGVGVKSKTTSDKAFGKAMNKTFGKIFLDKLYRRVHAVSNEEGQLRLENFIGRAFTSEALQRQE